MFFWLQELFSRKKSLNYEAFVASQKSDTVNVNAFQACCDFDYFHTNDEKKYWLLDSGASRHMFCRREWFAEFTSSRGEFVYLGDGIKITVEGRGTIFIKRFINDAWIDD